MKKNAKLEKNKTMISGNKNRKISLLQNTRISVVINFFFGF